MAESKSLFPPYTIQCDFSYDLKETLLERHVPFVEILETVDLTKDRPVIPETATLFQFDDLVVYRALQVVLVDKEDGSNFLLAMGDKSRKGEEGTGDLVENTEESFINQTAKSVALHIVFDLKSNEAVEFFKKLEEPLASRVFYYLTHLRGVGNLRDD